jgi:hypothetical protein
VTTFSTKSFKGALTRAMGLRARRSNLDKGTLAAAHLGLERASQRPPDHQTAYGPPPLVKPPAPFARKRVEAGGSGVRARRDIDHQGDGLSRE